MHKSLSFTFLYLIITGVLLISSQIAFSSQVTFSSPATRATLVELYTSEGCSSCPPADQWMSSLKTKKGLWKAFVPIAFHVDYWDHLGWTDKFADAKHAQRQSIYKAHQFISSVYTPAIINNGREWRWWRWGRNIQHDTHGKPGILSARLKNNNLTALFTPESPDMMTPLVLHVALLRMNEITEVKAGENKNKKLTHDFVVARHLSQSERDGETHKWSIDSLLSHKNVNIRAIALWLTTKDDPTPIQATGGWITSANSHTSIQ